MKISHFARQKLDQARQLRHQGQTKEFKEAIRTGYDELLSQKESFQASSPQDQAMAQSILKRSENALSDELVNAHPVKETALTLLAGMGASAGLPSSVAANALLEASLGAGSEKKGHSLALELAQDLGVGLQEGVGQDISEESNPTVLKNWQLGQFLSLSLDGRESMAADVADGRLNYLAGTDRAAKEADQTKEFRETFGGEFGTIVRSGSRTSPARAFYEFRQKGGGMAAFISTEGDEAEIIHGKVRQHPDGYADALFLVEGHGDRVFNGNYVREVAFPKSHTPKSEAPKSQDPSDTSWTQQLKSLFGK